MVLWAREVHEALLPRHLWKDPAEERLFDVAWRRSALDYLPRLLIGRTDPSQPVPMPQALAIEAEAIDRGLLDAWKIGPIGMPKAPQGVPRSHWWWHLQD